MLSGASSIKIESNKSELEINVWLHEKKYSMEIIIDVAGVNQALLPVDASGKLIETSTYMSAIPWVKVYWPGQGPVTLDVKCDSQSKKCVSLWANFPYNPAKDTAIKVEANLRGLEGKIWTPRFNIHSLYAGNTRELGISSKVLEPMYAIQPGARAARVRIRQHYDKSRLPPGISNFEIIRIVEWSFFNSEHLSETGFYRTLNPTLFVLDEGNAILQTLEEKTLQTFEMKESDTFWAPNPVMLSFASKQNSSAGQALFRLLEFKNKKQ